MSQTRPKIIFLVSEDWYFVSHRLPLACAARDAGYDVVVATRVANHADAIADAGLKLIPIAFERSALNPMRDAGVTAMLTRMYRRERPAIVHHVAVKPVILGTEAARRAGVPGIVNALMGLGFVFTSQTLKARMLRPLVRRALRRSLAGGGRRLIVQNRDDVELLEREAGVDPATIRLILGSGVDPEQFTPTPVPDGRPVVVFPARLLRDKGAIEFIEAARRLKRRGVEARFVLAGDPDPLNPSSLSPADIAAATADGSVEHWGWRTDMPKVFAAAHLVCLPSYREGLPKALLEAAASGRAIVATDVPGNREIVRPGENGWLVPARDANALADALAAAIGDAPRCRTYGARGRDMVMTEFSSRIIIEQTLGVYAELIAAKHVGGVIPAT